MTIQLADIFKGNYPITQGFGQNPAIYAVFGLAGHEGIDFGCPTGTEIWSTTDGIVLRAGTMDGWRAYGNFVEVWDDHQLAATLYGHLNDVLVRPGDRVHARQPIGHSNFTGNVRPPGPGGTHLHFGVLKTDAQGNRLYRTNSYGGWLNASEPPSGPSDHTPETFHWTFTNQVWTPPPPPLDPCADVKTQLASLQKEFNASAADWQAAWRASVKLSQDLSTDLAALNEIIHRNTGG